MSKATSEHVLGQGQTGWADRQEDTSRLLALRLALASLSILAVLIGLYFVSRSSYLLFHTIIEAFGVVVGCGVFVIAYNTRVMHRDGGLLLLGVSSLALGALGLLHMLAYRGMGIFPTYDANLPTQLWIAMRYVYSLSFLAALFWLDRPLNASLTLLIYGVVLALLVGTIFGRIFPTCYIEGVGLTPFKRNSEYLVSVILIVASGLLVLRRGLLDRRVFWMLLGSSVMGIFSGAAFTLYVGIYDIFNLIGHYFYLVSIFFLYKAIVETGLRRPTELLFRSLKQSEERLSAILGSISDGFFVLDDHLVVTYYNQAASLLLGPRPEDVLGKPLFDAFPEARGSIFEEKYTWAIKHKEQLSFETYFDVPPYENWYDVRVYPQENGISVYFRIVTERHHAEAMAQRVAAAVAMREAEEAERRRLARELHDQVGGNLSALQFSLSLAKRQAAPQADPKLSARLDDAIGLVQQTTQTLREVMTDLRPPLLDDYGVVAALRWYGEQLAQRASLEVSLEEETSIPRLEPAAEIALFRIAQEALSNAVKYAQAKRVTISLGIDACCLHMVIADDGLGFDPAQADVSGAGPRWGLRNMRERAEAVNGRCRIEATPGNGTQVIVELPLDALSVSPDPLAS